MASWPLGGSSISGSCQCGGGSACMFPGQFCGVWLLTESQDQDDDQRCAGMYSRRSWGGSVEPFILAKFIKPDGEISTNPTVSLVIFEWKDVDLIGVVPSDTYVVGCARNKPWSWTNIAYRENPFATKRMWTTTSATALSSVNSYWHLMPPKSQTTLSSLRQLISRHQLPSTML